MFLRPSVLCVVLGAALLSSATASAQLFGPRRPSPNDRDEGRNPVHERLKTEAKSAYEQRNFDKTVELTNTVLQQNPGDHLALYFRGSARIEQGQQRGDAALVRTGIADARQAVTLGATQNHVYYLPYLYGMTQLSVLERNDSHAKVTVDVAAKLLETVGLKDDEKAHVHYQRGVANAHLRSVDPAAADFQSAIRFSPKLLGAYIALANAYVAAGRFDEAKKAFDQAVAAFPSDALVYNNRGQFLQTRGEWADAVTDFTRAIERNPQFAVAYVNRGFTMMESGEPESAEADFTAALRIDANQPFVYGLRGASKLAQGKLPAAVADHEQVLKLQPTNPVAHADIAFARYYGGDYAGAAKGFAEALRLDPRLRYLGPWRFLSLDQQNQGDAARKEFATSLAKDEKDRDWVDVLLAFVAGTATDEQLLAKIDPKDAALQKAQTCEANFFIGTRLRRAGDATAAAKHYRKAVETNSVHLSAYRASFLALRDLPANTATGSP